jgi:predicted nucleic acid-binding protein
MSIIANTTVISNFACIGQSDLLRQLHKEIYISAEVYEEIQKGLSEGYFFYTSINEQIYPFCDSGWIKLTTLYDDNELRLFGKMPSRLHKGESSCLSIAYHRKWLFLTDDRDARIQAERLGIRFSGTIGCLILATEHHICTSEQANKWLYQMIQKGYHSPVNELALLLNL